MWAFSRCSSRHIHTKHADEQRYEHEEPQSIPVHYLVVSVSKKTTQFGIVALSSDRNPHAEAHGKLNVRISITAICARVTGSSGQ